MARLRHPYATIAKGVAEGGGRDTVYIMPGTHTVASQITVSVQKFVGAGPTSINSDKQQRS
jgi:hypothetical protein